MDRLMNKRLLLAAVQTAHDVDPVPTAASNAIEVYDMTLKPLVATKKDLKPVRPYPGGKAALLADQHLELTFKVAYAGSGTAGTAPRFGSLFRGCSLAEIITANTRVDYKPINSSQEEVTFYYLQDGLLHKLINAKGDVSLAADKGDTPMLSFTFTGMKGGRAVVPTPTNPSYVGFVDPIIVNDANSMMTLGGIEYPCKGLDLDLGNSVAFKGLVGKESVRISDRDTSGKLTLDLDPTQQLAVMAAVEASGTYPLVFTHGTTPGNIATITAPKVQLLEPAETDDGGDLLHSFSLNLLPVTGNDEVLFSFA